MDNEDAIKKLNYETVSFKNEMSGNDMSKIEKLLFQYYDNSFIDNTELILQENDLLELDEIFEQKQEHSQNEVDDNWGEPNSMVLV